MKSFKTRGGTLITLIIHRAFLTGFPKKKSSADIAFGITKSLVIGRLERNYNKFQEWDDMCGAWKGNWK